MSQTIPADGSAEGALKRLQSNMQRVDTIVESLLKTKEVQDLHIPFNYDIFILIDDSVNMMNVGMTDPNTGNLTTRWEEAFNKVRLLSVVSQY